MLEINMIEPKVKPLEFCKGIYILPLWKKVRTHFMTLTLKKNDYILANRYKLSLVIKDESN